MLSNPPLSPTFFAVPDAARYALRNVRMPTCLTELSVLTGEKDQADLSDVDLLIDSGRIAGVQPAGALPAELGPDLDHSMVLPGMIDCHTHLDKGHISPRKPNATGDFPGASKATGEDRVANWHAEDVRRRMEFGLMTAYAKGVVAIRTHLDSLEPQAAISFPVFKEMRAQWAGRIDLQASSIAPIDIFLTDEGCRLADIVADAGGNLGCVTRFRSLPNTLVSRSLTSP
ncbi:hypothetical protein [Pigmentiphaga litoralis]|uniref:hypothetical protein n=1 Tax=Pigmentiphaga litoralis TaxID=516702 RepID=UPI003B43540E